MVVLNGRVCKNYINASICIDLVIPSFSTLPLVQDHSIIYRTIDVSQYYIVCKVLMTFSSRNVQERYSFSIHTFHCLYN